MRDINYMERDMVEVNSTIRMEACTMGTGYKIKWMVMDPYTMSLGKLHMRDNGKMINFMEGVNSTTNILIF